MTSGTDRNPDAAVRPVSEPTPGTADPADLDWSVGRVADRLGIPTATLRTWDRRYGVGPSQRTAGGHRRYSEEDIRRVRVMSRFIDKGVPAQSAARVASAMDTTRLQIETAEDHPVNIAGDRGRVAAITSAALALDPESLARLYQTTLRERDLVSAWTDVFAPAMREIGEQWGTGTLGVESEHLASEMLVTELRAVVSASRPQRVHSDVILASADEEQHYLPLLALQAELARQGLGVSYLGPRMPTHALSTVMRTRRPDRVFLWASLSRASNEPIWQTLNVIDHPMLLVIGGPGWPDTTPPVSPHVTVARAHDLATAANLLMHPPESRA